MRAAHSPRCETSSLPSSRSDAADKPASSPRGQDGLPGVFSEYAQMVVTHNPVLLSRLLILAGVHTAAHLITKESLPFQALLPIGDVQIVLHLFAPRSFLEGILREAS